MTAQIDTDATQPLTSIDRLLYEVLPALMHEHVCVDQALALQTVLLDGKASEDLVIDELDNCWAAGCDIAADCPDDVTAEQAERVGNLARHLAQYFMHLDAVPEAAGRHLDRAAKIAGLFDRYAEHVEMVH